GAPAKCGKCVPCGGRAEGGVVDLSLHVGRKLDKPDGGAARGATAGAAARRAAETARGAAETTRRASKATRRAAGDAAVADAAARQHGVVTRAQLHAAGLGDKAIASR